MKLEIHYRKKMGKMQTTWRLNHMLLKIQQINEKTKKEIRKHLEANENKKKQFSKIYPIQQKQFTLIQAYLKK